jgi:hypothetical protein
MVHFVRGQINSCRLENAERFYRSELLIADSITGMARSFLIGQFFTEKSCEDSQDTFPSRMESFKNQENFR